MAAAWHGSLDDGAWYANDPKLKAAISSAMDYWFGRDFKNPRCLDEGGKDGCPCDNPDNALWYACTVNASPRSNGCRIGTRTGTPT